MTPMRERLLQFVAELRAREVRISVAETLDAVRAVAAAGLERARMREALAATLVKDEADRVIFDETFERVFALRGPGGERRPPTTRRRPVASQGGPGRSGEAATERPKKPEEKSARAATAESASPKEVAEEAREPRETALDRERPAAPSSGTRDGEERELPAGGDTDDESGRLARARKVARTPFVRYSEFDYELARSTLVPMVRRFRVRLSRRLRTGRGTRLDFRRTIRAAIQRAGALFELKFRARRPRHVDLTVLADVSGSVRYAAALLLELMAGLGQSFSRVRSFVFVDRLAEASFEGEHLAMTPVLDLYARSDFGRVLGEVWERRNALLGRATVLVVMGDGRNNYRNPRVDLLEAASRLCRAVIWLNPEPKERWGTGDSATPRYARAADAMLPCASLSELEQALKRAF